MTVIIIRPPGPAAVPAAVTRAQAMVALYEAGLLETVEAAVASHPYEVVRIWWANALQIERGDAYLAGVAEELNLSDEDVDALFIAASTRL